MNTDSLEQAFTGALSVVTGGEGNWDDFYGFFDETALFVNEDIPFVLDQAALQDHMGFIADGMDTLEWVLREPTYQVFGDTGLISAELTVRGKPKSAGFRQRHSVLTAVCHWDGSTWRGVNLHTSTMLSHIYHMSPG